MNPRCLLLAASSALLLSSCASVPTDASAPSPADMISAAVQPICKHVVLPVLSHNPRYEPALLALAAGADAALNAGQLTPESIRAFVDALALKYELTPEARLSIASGIDDLVQLYQRTYGQSVASTADPRVRKILTAFAAGIRDGVKFYHAMQPAA